ncbi:MAG: outer membrane lipoprotein-sorting protein [Spirochaetales bacterium]|nr:outer membrane lipoprotein-sorting protein [Spirochaetales bacterium]
MKRTIILILSIILIAAFQTVTAQSAEEIVARTDEMMNYESAYTESRMVNTDRFGTKTIAYSAWSEGTNFLMEFTSDAEYGQKILRTEDRIYHFFPDSEAIFTKSKGDSIAGLISYEDVTDESGMLENYDVTLEGEENLEGILCYRIAMKVKRRKRVAYPVQIVWIEKETFIMRRIEMFTRSNQPLKTMVIRQVDEFNGHLMATDIILTDDVRRGVSSEIFIDKVELNIPIPDSKFTRRELTR